MPFQAGSDYFLSAMHTGIEPDIEINFRMHKHADYQDGAHLDLDILLLYQPKIAQKYNQINKFIANITI